MGNSYWVAVSGQNDTYMYGPFVDIFSAQQWAKANENSFLGRIMNVVRPTQFIDPSSEA